jgi:hypothetical protein
MLASYMERQCFRFLSLYFIWLSVIRHVLSAEMRIVRGITNLGVKKPPDTGGSFFHSSFPCLAVN